MGPLKNAGPIRALQRLRKQKSGVDRTSSTTYRLPGEGEAKEASEACLGTVEESPSWRYGPACVALSSSSLSMWWSADAGALGGCIGRGGKVAAKSNPVITLKNGNILMHFILTCWFSDFFARDYCLVGKTQTQKQVEVSRSTRSNNSVHLGVDEAIRLQSATSCHAQRRSDMPRTSQLTFLGATCFNHSLSGHTVSGGK